MSKAYLKRICLAVPVFLLLFIASSHARDINFKIDLSRKTVQPGRQVEMYLYFFDSMDIPAPGLPYIEGLDFKYSGSKVVPARESGLISDSLRHTYTVVPLKGGEFRIGPLSFSYRGNNYTSNTVFLKVSKDAEVPLARRKEARPDEEDIKRRIYLKVDIPRTTVYVNEKVPVTVKFYTDWLDVENLEISDQPSKEYITEQYRSIDPAMIVSDGVRYAVLRFRKSFFILEPGEYTFGPVKASFDIAKARAEVLNDNQAFYNSFLGGRDSRHMELEAEPIKISVVPVPSRGRPADFSGAIGNFGLEVSVDKKTVKVGEPIIITMTVTGEGNFNTVKAPAIRETDAFTVYEAQELGGEDNRVFTQVIKPASPDARAIPRVSFSYFDPDKAEFVTLTQGNIPIEVIGPPSVQKKPEGVTKPLPARKPVEEELGTGIIYIKDFPGELERGNPHAYKSKGVIFLGIFPLLLFFGAVITQKRMKLLEEDTSYAGWLSASRRASRDIAEARSLLRVGKAKEFYQKVFKLMQVYLGTRLGVPPEGVTEQIVDDRLSGKIHRDDITEKIRAVFSDCYLGLYTRVKMDKSDMKSTLGKIKELVGYLNSKRSL
ncbi:MAG: hypothetical protein GF409_06545 [Candidatus Omnitrophica bacterium]|nr:hypothetical protein [Candidatus Omnitrophota bacterium]